MTNGPVSRSKISTWWICGLLLCASTINYMDRQTLANVSQRIITEFELSKEQYGYIETAFGLAFAAGALLFGVIADRTNVRWLYPIVLLLWSMMGFLTGFVETYAGLLLCRLFLGLFEAGHWPCALKTTYRLLPPESRALGNSVLQSGTAIGAIVTPVIMLRMLTDAPGSWRPVFQIIAAVGAIWAVLWVVSTRSEDLAPVPAAGDASGTAPGTGDTFVSAVLSRKFLLLVVIVVAINACWHLFRVWMPQFLMQGRNYTEKEMLGFMFWYNTSTDVGCLSAGLLTRRLHRGGFSVHWSRCVTFGICAVLVALGGLIPWLPAGPGLTTVLLLVAAGSLGLFPCYYSFSQELSTRHQGKVLGLLGTIAWITSSPLHPLFGKWIDQTKSYDMGMALTCGLPLFAFVVLAGLWPAHDTMEDASPVKSNA
ncbi:MFS transporter [Schlesneria paludicola]|uniref:MFS transporter n=1 Tax=Schlesneria paludicola TaxID=360056 RepID=UPI000299E461|nr:MFS transporter [Schlesneria paludicola]